MMKLFALFSGLVVAVAGLDAQILTPGAPVLQIPYSQLVTFLNLSSAQLQALEQLQLQKNQAIQVYYKQISDKQALLTQQLNSPTPDPFQVGQLTIDIRTLQRQTQDWGKPFRQPALAVLTSDQLNKLQVLVTALQLQGAASQAISLNLIDSPYTVVPVGTLAPVKSAEFEAGTVSVQ